MADPISTPSFSTLLQRFFVEHLGRQRAVSPRTETRSDYCYASPKAGSARPRPH